MPAVIQAIGPFIIALLPFLAFAISYAIQRLENSPKQNTAIAGTSIIIACIITALLQGKLTGNWTTDMAYVLAMATALQSEVFIPLQQWMRGNFPTPGEAPNLPPIQPLPPNTPKQ